jgi:hypothetical protein
MTRALKLRGPPPAEALDEQPPPRSEEKPRRRKKSKDITDKEKVCTSPPCASVVSGALGRDSYCVLQPADAAPPKKSVGLNPRTYDVTLLPVKVRELLPFVSAPFERSVCVSVIGGRQ